MQMSETQSLQGGVDSFSVRFLMKAIHVVAWLREQWLLWLMLLSVGAAYVSPLVVSLSATPIVSSISTSITFFLTGLTLPLAELKSVPRQLSAIAVVLLLCFVVAPLLGLTLYFLPFADDMTQKLLLAGILSACCLPTPMLVATIATAAAGGSESTSQSISIVANIIGLSFVSPLGIQLVLRLTEATPTASKEDIPWFLGTFALFSMLPFVAGHLVQQLIQSTSLRHLIASDEHLKRQMTSATITCSEVCDTTHSNWRHRARQLSIATLMFMNYIVFSGLFHHRSVVHKEMEVMESVAKQSLSSPPGPIEVPFHAADSRQGASVEVTWSGIGFAALAVFCLQSVLALLGWGLSGLLSNTITAEERIAVFFLSFEKNELLAIPLVIQMCGCNTRGSDPRVAAILVLPCLMMHFFQSILGGLLTHPIRQWRNRQHCRPGTTLLPLKYTKVPKHAAPAQQPACQQSLSLVNQNGRALHSPPAEL